MNLNTCDNVIVKNKQNICLNVMNGRPAFTQLISTKGPLERANKFEILFRIDVAKLTKIW